MSKRNLKAALATAMIIGMGGVTINASATDLNTNALVNVVAPISISQTTPLDFGDVAQAAVGPVTVTVTANSVGGAVTSGSTPAAGLAAGTANEGVFAVNGILNESYTVSFASGVIPGGMTLGGFNAVSAGGYLLSAGAGADTLYVGAQLTIPDTTAPGAYLLPYTITVEYN